MSLQFKRSTAMGIEPNPQLLQEGELAINLADARLFTKDHNENIINIGVSANWIESNFISLTGGVVSGPVTMDSTFAGYDYASSDLVPRSQVQTMLDALADGTKLANKFLNKRDGDTITGAVTSTFTVTDPQHIINRTYADSRYLRLDESNEARLLYHTHS